MFPHWRYIRCKIRRVTTRAHRAVYPTRRVNCPARYRAARRGYVIGPRMPDSLHGMVVPYRWVVLFARHGPHTRPVAYQCARERLECAALLLLGARARTALEPLSFCFFLLILIVFPWLYSSRVSFSVCSFTCAPPRGSLSLLLSDFFLSPMYIRESKREEERVPRSRKLRYLGLKSILTPCDA